MAVRKTINDCWLLKSKTCTWWRNESLQKGNLKTWNRKSLIRTRIRKPKIISNHNTWHAFKVRKRVFLKWNRAFETRELELKTEKYSFNRTRWDKESNWQFISHVFIKRRRLIDLEVNVLDQVFVRRSCYKNV